jgi:hypothetical protein
MEGKMGRKEGRRVKEEKMGRMKPSLSHLNNMSISPLNINLFR